MGSSSTRRSSKARANTRVDGRELPGASVLNALWDGPGLGVAQVAPDSVILHVNHGLSAMLGYAPDELHGSLLSDLVQSDDRRAYARALEAVSAGSPASQVLEQRLIRRDQSIMSARATLSHIPPTALAGPTVLCVITAINGMDTTEQRRIERDRAAELRRAQAVLAAGEATRQQAWQILDSITDGFLAFDSEWRFTYVNPLGAQMLGRPAADLLGKNLWEEFPELAETNFGRLYKRAHAEGVLLELEDFYPPFNRWFAARAYPSPAGLTIYFRDVTERKQAEAEREATLRALHENRERLSLAFRAAHLGMWDWDVVNNVQTWDGEQAQLFGIAPEEFGKSYDSFLDLVHPEDRARIAETSEHTLAAAADYDNEYRVIWPDGSVHWLAAKGRVYRDEQGRVVRMTGVNFDITEQKRAEEERARLLARSQEARAAAERAMERTARLQAITAALAEAFTVGAVADVVISQGIGDMGAAAGSIVMLNDDRQELAILRSVGYPAEIITPYQRFPVTAPVPLAEVVRTGMPLWLESLEAQIARFPALSMAGALPRNHAIAAMPLWSEGRAIGALGLSFTEARPFSKADRDYMLAIARQCTLALERARLYEAEQVARHAAELAANRVARLQAVTSALSEALTPTQVGAVIAAQGVAALDAAGAYIALLSTDGQELELIGVSGLPLAQIEAWRRFPVMRSVPIAEAVRTGQAVWLESRAERVAHYPHLADAYADTGYDAWVSLPMQVEGRIVGGMSFSFAAERQPSAADREFMIALAQQCAQALDRARLYEAERNARAQAERAEHAKAESLALLRTLFETAPVGLGFFDRELRFARVNEALAMINGVPVEAHIGRTIQEVLPNMTDEVVTDLRRVLETGIPVINQEVQGETPAAPGKRRTWLASYYQVRGAGTEAYGLGAVVQEITERKRAEEAQQFILEASAVLSASLDYEATLRWLTQLIVPRLADWSAVNILERDGSIRRLEVAHVDPAKAARVKTLLDRYPPNPANPDGVSHVLRTGKAQLVPYITEEMIVASRGHPELRQLVRELGLSSIMIVPLLVGGHAVGAISFVAAESGRRYDAQDLALAEDLAYRAALAVENARLYREAQQAIEARDDFLSIASHELKTPLTSLQLQAQSVLRLARKGGSVTLPAERLLNKMELIDQQANRLARLANDLLDVARIRSGRIEFHFEEVDLAALIREIAARSEEQLAHAGCELTLALDEPLVIRSDRSRLEQVLTNLLGNAIKYGAGKPIEIRAAGDDHGLRVVVRDHGIGISPDDQARIWARFERAVSSRNYGGLGLGLYIVRQIVEALGGSVAITSAVGAGATFTVSLPHRPAVEPVRESVIDR